MHPRSPYTETAKQFWKSLLLAADPSVDVESLSMKDLVQEGRNLALMLAKQFGRKNIKSRIDSADRAKQFIDWHGLRLGLTHRKGMETRHGRPMHAHYGYVRGTYGLADDGMAYDVYVGDNKSSRKVFKVKQLIPATKEHDEFKYVLGVDGSQAAKELYLQHMPLRFYGGVQRSSIEEIRPARQDAGKPCGEGWIEKRDKCSLDARRDRSIKRLRGESSKGGKIPDSIPVAPSAPAKIKGTNLVVKGFYPEDSRIAKLFHQGKDNRKKIREVRPRHPSVQMNLMREVMDKSRVSEDKVFASLSSRHRKVLRNSTQLIRGMTKAEHEAFAEGDPNFPDTFRHIYDEEGMIQMASIIGFSKDGTLNVHEMMTAPWNLNGAIKKSLATNAGLSPAEIEAMQRTSSVNSADALESFIAEAETVRSHLKSPGDIIIRCQPLKENIRWFAKAGMVHDGGKDYVLTVDAAQKFREKRMIALSKRMDSESPEDWYSDLLELETETGGFLASRSVARADSVNIIEESFDKVIPASERADSDNIYPEDWVVDHYSQKLGPHIGAWVERLGKWIGAFSSLEEASTAILRSPKDALKAMSDDGSFAREMAESLYLTDLEGRRTVLEDDMEELRQDAFNAPAPAWLGMQFQEAVDYFRNKTPVPVNSTKGAAEGYHDWAFSIAGMTKADILQAAKWLIDRSIAEGMAFDEFKRQWQRLIGRRGWVPRGSGSQDRRIYTIVDTNYRGAFGAGRQKQMDDPDILKSRPYRLLRHRDSPNFRPVHKRLHNNAIPASHSFWRRVRVPGGHGCRCAVYAVDEAIIKSRGYKINLDPPHPHAFADPGFRSPFNFNASGAKAISDLKLKGNPFIQHLAK